jgi:PHD/YefM family antitoxin component YafN of YafNO toxin-antitoxin module
MKVIGLSEVKDKLSSIINDAQQSPVIITRNGKTAAILIVPENDDDAERILLSRSKKLKAILEQSRAAAKRGDVVSLEEAFG